MTYPPLLIGREYVPRGMLRPTRRFKLLSHNEATGQCRILWASGSVAFMSASRLVREFRLVVEDR